MSKASLLETDIIAYLHEHENKDLLRFITCGSVDDGKSTLIGRLLHDSKMIYEDQLAAISRDSKTHGTVAGEVDLALLVDGLQSEREQGITIDVAYRYFSTDKRKFIIADTPGHEQYTRNMATGASTAHLAILLIDARSGVQVQTKRHSFICSLLGIQHFIIAVNKMDLVGFDQQTFEDIKAAYESFASQLNVPDIQFVPVSALTGDNVTALSEKMPWYQGPPLLDLLENVNTIKPTTLKELRLPVQYVNRPDHTFRGFCGTLASGKIAPGDPIQVLPSKKKSRVDTLWIADQQQPIAWPGDAITVTLADEIDISRGDMIVAETAQLDVQNQFEVDVVWMHDVPLTCHKQYVIKLGPREVIGFVEDIHFEVNVNTQAHHKVQRLNLNGIGRVRLVLTEPVLADAYQQIPQTGSLIFIDRLTNITVGAGMIHPDSVNLGHERQVSSERLSAEQRGCRFFQKPAVIELKGSADLVADFSTKLETRLCDIGHQATLIDKDHFERQVQATQSQPANGSQTAIEPLDSMVLAAQVAVLLRSGIVVIDAVSHDLALSDWNNTLQAQTQALGITWLSHSHTVEGSSEESLLQFIEALCAEGILEV